MSAQPTPGPWVVAHSFRGIYSQAPAPGPVQVCRAPEHFHAQWEANAPVIAAAPELLAALKAVRPFINGYAFPGALAQVDAAIAKATAATHGGAA